MDNRELVLTKRGKKVPAQNMDFLESVSVAPCGSNAREYRAFPSELPSIVSPDLHAPSVGASAQLRVALLFCFPEDFNRDRVSLCQL